MYYTYFIICSLFLAVNYRYVSTNFSTKTIMQTVYFHNGSYVKMWNTCHVIFYDRYCGLWHQLGVIMDDIYRVLQYISCISIILVQNGNISGCKFGAGAISRNDLRIGNKRFNLYTRTHTQTHAQNHTYVINFGLGEKKKKMYFIQYYRVINLGRNAAYGIQRNKMIVKMTIRP